MLNHRKKTATATMIRHSSDNSYDLWSMPLNMKVPDIGTTNCFLMSCEKHK